MHFILKVVIYYMFQDVLTELDTLVDQFTSAKDALTQKRLLNKMMNPLIKSQVSISYKIKVCLKKQD